MDSIGGIIVERAMGTVVERSIERECVPCVSFVLGGFGEEHPKLCFFVLLENSVEKDGRVRCMRDSVWIWIYYSCLFQYVWGREAMKKEIMNDLLTLPFLSDYPILSFA